MRASPRRVASLLAQSNAVRAPAGIPSSAYRIAGSRLASRPSFPIASDRVIKPSMAPGNVTAPVLPSAIVSPSARRAATSSPAGARPDPFNARTGSPGVETSAKQSPPMPVDCGSLIPRMTAAAIAASTALPPRSNNSTATLAASGLDVAHMPFAEMTGERPGNWKSRTIRRPFDLHQSRPNYGERQRCRGRLGRQILEGAQVPRRHALGGG